ncbi:hypothetical protein [Rhizobium sp. 1399]|uniref:hypothetical protein n=1 Tax=Rhizobium sp. 1399 TaxID=2817758 RepID=UPI00286119EE|nr:hypothetical protein [Rhizobium sp. 1399]MDR6667987.1 hypothetical protein [Rhizobium sp. 1399]
MDVRKVLRFKKDMDQGLAWQAFYDPQLNVELTGDQVPSGRFEIVKVSNAGRTEEVETWVPPVMKAPGTHMPPKRNKFAARAFIPDIGTNTQVGNASFLELKCAMHFMANRRVTSIVDQHSTYEYADENGELRSHRIDFLIEFDSGLSLAIAVKSEDRVDPAGLDKIVKHIRPQLSGVADDLIILTDAHLTNDRAWNNQSIIRARKARKEDDCETLRAIIRDIHGSFNAYEMTLRLPSVAAGETAIWCLLYDGVLKMVRPDRRLCDAPFVFVDRAALHSGQPAPTRPGLQSGCGGQKANQSYPSLRLEPLRMREAVRTAERSAAMAI